MILATGRNYLKRDCTKSPRDNQHDFRDTKRRDVGGVTLVCQRCTYCGNTVNDVPTEVTNMRPRTRKFKHRAVRKTAGRIRDLRDIIGGGFGEKFSGFVFTRNGDAVSFSPTGELSEREAMLVVRNLANEQRIWTDQRDAAISCAKVLLDRCSEVIGKTDANRIRARLQLANSN